MMNRQRLIALLSVVALLFASVPSGAQSPSRSDAATAADIWWMRLWAGRYEQSWELLAQYARAKISRDDWYDYAKKTYEPLGKVQARRVVKIERLEPLPDAPGAERVAVVYESDYAKSGAVVETFILMSEKCGAGAGGSSCWRVASYAVRKGTTTAPFELIPR